MDTIPSASGGFESTSLELEIKQAGEIAIVAREQNEIQSAIISAKRFPRDEAASYVKAMKSFQRPALAEAARYSFSRGKTKVVGPSIDCARELARCWTNLRHGIRIVAIDEKQVHIKGFALDLENNNYVEAEDRFAKLVQRKDGGVTKWVVPDERDLRELIGRRGSILVRNSILQILPPDLVDEAMRNAQLTLTKAAAGQLEQNREDAIRRLVMAFDEIGVTSEMLQKKLEHELALLTEHELVELRAIWKSIKDGHTQRTEHFEFAQREDHSQSTEVANLLAQNKGKKKGGEGV